MKYFWLACLINLSDRFNNYYYSIHLNYSFSKYHFGYFLNLWKLNFLKDESHSLNFKYTGACLNWSSSLDFLAMVLNNLNIWYYFQTVFEIYNANYLDYLIVFKCSQIYIYWRVYIIVLIVIGTTYLKNRRS